MLYVFGIFLPKVFNCLLQQRIILFETVMNQYPDIQKREEKGYSDIRVYENHNISFSFFVLLRTFLGVSVDW